MARPDAGALPFSSGTVLTPQDGLATSNRVWGRQPWCRWTMIDGTMAMMISFRHG